MIWPKWHKNVEQLSHLGVFTRHTTDHLDWTIQPSSLPRYRHSENNWWFTGLCSLPNTHSQTRGLQPFYNKGPHLLIWSGWWASHGKMIVRGIPNLLNYFVIFIVYTQFTYVAAGCKIQPGRPHRPVGCGLETHALPHGTQSQIGLKDSMGQKFQALLPPCSFMCALTH